MTLILGNDDVERLLTMDLCIGALEPAYRELAAGEALTRPRSDCLSRGPSADSIYGLKSMDGVVPSAKVGAIRINSDIITWPREQGTHRRVKMPVAPGQRYVGLVLLFSTDNGEPLAIFPDGVMQQLRVGATSGLGAKYMSREDATTVGLLGSGWQAQAQVLAICAVRPIKKIRVFSPNEAHRQVFVQFMAPKIDAEIEAVSTPDAAMAGADIAMCATNAIEAVFFDKWIRPGLHVTAIKRPEISQAVVAAADRVVIHTAVPTPMQEVSANLDALPQRYKDDKEAVEMAGRPLLIDLVSGRLKGRQSDAELTCFINNLGLGLQFAAAGAALYRRAVETGAGHVLPTEWFTQDVHP